MRGGRREGAGRKKKADARVVISASVAKATRDKLKRLTEETGERLGVVLDSRIENVK